MNKNAQELHGEGDIHHAEGRHEEALRSFRDALTLSPDSVVLHFNVGNVLRYLKRPLEAVAAYDQALALAPGFAMAHHNKATCLLQLGELAAGFREYEWRKACPGFADDTRYSLERPWRGEDLQGRTLFIYPELFQGDLLQFGRYAVMAERLGAKVLLGAPVAMHALLRTMSPTLMLVPDDGPPPDYDYQCALMTLPAMFGTTLETAPRAPNYFRAEPARVARWRDRIGPHGLKVGIAWQGSALATQRSFPLAVAAERFSGLPDVRLISLQKHNGLEQLEDPANASVETLGEDFDPGPDAFLDTAAAMTCCDLFITPDTSVVHVAGGLGVRTWLALPFVGDWRWLQEQADTPWYPSVRIFRQQSPDDWSSAFMQMSALLQHSMLGGASMARADIPAGGLAGGSQ